MIRSFACFKQFIFRMLTFLVLKLLQYWFVELLDLDLVV